MSAEPTERDLDRIAVVGMAGRFPRAATLAAFWQNLVDGVESISFYSPEELKASGVPQALLDDPNYVRAQALLEAFDRFDAPFFGFTPREAEITNPQNRLFLECCWEAFEDAGIDPAAAGAVGVFASASSNTYILDLFTRHDLIASVGGVRVQIANEKEFLPTWASYKLDLRGPSVNVQTACSSSLVAVHMAVQSLLNGECDLALAGGVSVRNLERGGYFYVEGAVLSHDGRCRAFDAAGNGTVNGDGAGVVLLKRLEDALEAGDNVRAVILGSAINNDGARKVGFTAPSEEGQTRVIAEALSIAGIDPGSLGYVEAHGTATRLGDPIEIAALSAALRSKSPAKSFCAIGSVKTNLGHLDAGAGVAGLIKTVLALENRTLPPSLHFERPNPEIDFAGSPVYVNTTAKPWESKGMPRRAGVSSFGIGGTNAHVILEEAPELPSGPSRERQLLVWSARTPTALDAMTVNLAAALGNEEISLPDAAFTLASRRPFEHRRAAVAGAPGEAAAWVADAERTISGHAPAARPVAFLFPGQGAQKPGATRALYETEKVFRQEVDRSAEILRPLLGEDLRRLLYPEDGAPEEAERRLAETFWAQPAVFVVDYALARLWMSWGVRPQALLGHSLGEYVAATLAGVLSLEDALALVALRGRLMQDLPQGAMLAVPLSEETVSPLLGPDLALAAVNAAERTVVSGPAPAIAELEKQLAARGLEGKLLRTSHAFHSAMMESMIPAFADKLRATTLNAPKIPYVSNVSGDWITDAQATDPAFWLRQLREPVRFAEGAATLLAQRDWALLEVGPGRTLYQLLQQHPGRRPEHRVVGTLARTAPATPEPAALLEALASLWVAGVEVDWKAYYRGERRRKVSLPTYPFERQRYFIERAAGAAAAPWTELAARQALASNLEEGVMAMKEGNEVNRTEEALTPVPSPGAGEGRPLPPAEMTPARRALLEMLKNLVHELSGMDPESFDPKASFLDIGVDSLMMIQATQKLRDMVGVKLTVVQLLEELPTLDSLAAHLEREMAPEKLAELLPPEPAAPVQTFDRTDPSDPADRTDRSAAEPVAAPRPAAAVSLPALAPAAGAEPNALTHLFAQQLQILSQQLQVLQGATVAATPFQTPVQGPIGAQSARPSTPEGSAERTGTATTAVREAGAGASATERSFDGTPKGRDSEPSGVEGRALPQAPAAQPPWTQFGPYHPIPAAAQDGLDARQRAYLDRFIRRYTARTAKSKELTQTHRAHLADGRATVAFRRLWKEIVYPIHSAFSAGSRITDVDGNEYVDINMGFGLHFFGHSPDFLVQALESQLHQGIEVGPQPVLAGQAADLLCELTGMDRAMFCTSGTEAILGALRVARTVTGRTKVVVLSDSWHGWSDSTVVRRPPAGRLGAVPGAPGISPRTLEEIIVLDFGTPETLEQIRSLGGEIAAVLVEPVRSRWPEVQPREFLHELRRLTRESGSALVFDEIVTGFRIHPGGAQAHFGVEADLATYGKLLGGGLPIGVLAGRNDFMNALDGGPWRFGDDSYPQAEKTLFTGTFFKHPLALAAVHAVLRRIREAGPALYETLNARTSLLAADLSAYFRAASVPLDVYNFGSLFRFRPRKEMKYPELFYFHLVDHGIYFTQESGNCFLTPAHSEEDIARIQRAVELSVEDLTEGGFLEEARAVPMPGLDIAHAGPAEAARRPAPTLPALEGPPDGQPVTVLELPVPDNQRVIWIACKMGPAANRSYNEPLALRFRGPLHFAALHAAAQEVSNRHQALRASFNAEGSLLRIRSWRHVPLPLIDYSGLPEAARGPEMDWCLKYLAGLAFDLEEGPLMRVAVTRWAPDEHYLSLTAHHIVIDGPSAGVMVRELALLYGAYSRGETADLIHPGSLEGWVWRTVSRKETDPDQQEAEFYFRQLFLEPVELIDLPLDRPRPRSVPFWGDRRRYFMEPELVAELKRLGNTYRATPFAVVLAAFGAMLHELTQQERIIVGIPSRDPSVSGAMVGYYINLLPVRMFRDSGETYATRLGKVRKTLFELQTHQSYPLNRLLEKLGLAGGLDGFLVGTTFNHEKMDASPPMPGLEADVVWVYHDAARIDLHLNVIEDGKTGSGLLEFAYKTTFMDAASVDRWLKSLVTVLRQVAKDPQTDLRELPLLDPADRQQLVVEWNDTAIAPDAVVAGQEDATLHRLFEIQAAKNPAAPAVSLGTEELSYGDLDQLSTQLAGHLAAMGVGPDVKVGLSLDRSFELIVALLAILKAGGAYVPLEPTQPRERLLFLLEDSGARLLLTRSWVAEKLGPGLADLGVRAFDVDQDWPESEPPALERPPLPDSLAYVIYTSGSTGKPNGVGVSHRSAVNLVRQMEEPFRVTPRSRIAMIASFGFDVSVFEVFTSFAYGACLCLIRDEELGNPAVLADRLARQKVTTAFATPSRLSVLPDGPLGGLVNLGAGGEALSADIVNKWSRGRRLINCYGPTETTIYSTIAIFEDATLDKAPVIGRPIGNLQNHIVNRELKPVPMGVGGQLAIGGVGVGRGYLGRPDKTAAKFVPDPFAALRGEPGARLYLTGDRARFTTDGRIDYMGRSDDQIKLRGYRIELGEIESVVAACPGVRETAVAVRGQGAGEMLAAYVVWEEGAERDLAPLKRTAEAQLPEYMVPAAWIELKELPKTVNGKIDRLSLRAKQQESEERPHVDPETPLEVFLVDLWKEVLHLDKLSLHDNFLELGGNSISAAMLAFRLQELVHENIHALVVFDAPTIADLARFMAERYPETVVRVWGEESMPESVKQAVVHHP